MKKNKSYVQTDQAIRQVFTTLLCQKPFMKITIQAVMSIRTEDMNFHAMISEYFEKLFRKSSSHGLKPKELLDLEAHIYAAFINGISQYYLDKDRKTIAASFALNNRAIVDACLYTMDIRDRTSCRKIYQYIQQFLPCEQNT